MFGKKSAEKRVTEVRLVEAAAQLFAGHGFKATSTREIAQLANLHQVTLFRYFPQAGLIASRAGASPEPDKPWPGSAGKPDRE